MKNTIIEQLRIYVKGVSIVGWLLMISSCSSMSETPGHRPGASLPPPTQQQTQEALMERSTAEWAYQQGLQALNRDAQEEAIQYFQMAIERDMMHLRAYLSLGDVYNMQGNYMLAETYYNKVLTYDPNSVPAYTALATMHWKIGNYRESLSLYRKVLEIDPSSQFAQQQIQQVTQDLFNYYYEQGNTYKKAGDVELAVIEFQKAQSLYPENLEFTVEIGNLFLQLQDYMMADGYFQQALSQDSNYLPAIIGAGKVQLALEHYNEAMNYFKEGTKLQPKNPEADELFNQAQSEKIRRSLPPHYLEVMTEEQVSRGDVAAVLMVELVLESRLQPPSSVTIISDITTHWAKPYIIKAVELDIMEIFPDRSFLPYDPIHKRELALILNTLFRELGLPLPDAGAVSFTDVYPNNIYYDAILRVYAAGLMSASSDGVFGINNTISGEELMEIIARVKHMIQ